LIRGGAQNEANSLNGTQPFGLLSTAARTPKPDERYASASILRSPTNRDAAEIAPHSIV
jgi:hypothetical protein